MPDQSIPLNTVFHALADPTRRAVIQRLSGGAATVTELSEPFDMALQSFVQHLKVLEDCGLINSRKVGRVRMCQIAPDRLDGAQEWISELRIAWEKHLDRLDEYLEIHAKRKRNEQ
jgi:DNA-binding transcriptional ArsR family regulator